MAELSALGGSSCFLPRFLGSLGGLVMFVGYLILVALMIPWSSGCQRPPAHEPSRTLDSPTLSHSPALAGPIAETRGYHTDCINGSFESCEYLGLLYLNGSAEHRISANLQYAALYFRWACERGHASSCQHLKTTKPPVAVYRSPSTVSIRSLRLLLYGGTDHEVFLGCLTCSKYDRESVLNDYGPHGNSYSRESIRNDYSPYGSEYSSESACNEYAANPPVVVDDEGHFYGRLTLNQHHAQAITEPTALSWLKLVCSDADLSEGLQLRSAQTTQQPGIQRSMPSARRSKECHRATVLRPSPYLANGGEVIELDDGTKWMDVSYQYLYLYEYQPTITIYPSRGKLIIGKHVLDVIPR